MPSPKAQENDPDRERQLIEAAKHDPRHFAELYDAYFDRIYAFSIMRTRDREAAQDITSEVFHQALKNLSRFEWRGVPFSAWLYKIAANAIANRVTRNTREQTGSPVELAPESASCEELEAIEQRADIWSLLRDLPADQRRVLEMRFVEEKSIRDIAAELGRSDGAVKQLQFRALQNVRDRLTLTGDRHG
jgi:RNA polymerase sigma-70 factor (ECF subfamily)